MTCSRDGKQKRRALTLFSAVLVIVQIRVCRAEEEVGHGGLKTVGHEVHRTGIMGACGGEHTKKSQWRGVIREYEEGPHKEARESLDTGRKSGAKGVSGGRHDTIHPGEH